MRHSFVSLLSGSGVALEEIARLCGHSCTAVTEAVYRHQLKPVMDEGATAIARRGHNWLEDKRRYNVIQAAIFGNLR